MFNGMFSGLREPNNPPAQLDLYAHEGEMEYNPPARPSYEPEPEEELSPFDAIKQTSPDGSEFWSARDLAPMMGYGKWQSFETPLKRAMKSAEVQGTDVTSNFTRSRKITATKPQEDFELTRFAAYLVAMNGDPNKPEVAAAQAYFAIKTREAETRPAVPELSRLDLIQLAMDAERERIQLEYKNQALETKIESDRPKIDFHDSVVASSNLIDVQQMAQLLCNEGFKIGRNRLYDWLRANGYIFRDADNNHRAYQSAVEQGWLEVVETAGYDRYGTHRIGTKVMVTGKGQVHLVNKFRRMS